MVEFKYRIGRANSGRDWRSKRRRRSCHRRTSGGARGLGADADHGAGLVERAEIVLAAAAGMAKPGGIAAKVGCARGMMSKWRLRLASDRRPDWPDVPRWQAEDPRRTPSAHPGRAGPAAAGGVRPWTALLDRRRRGDVNERIVLAVLEVDGWILAGRTILVLSTNPSSPSRPPTSSALLGAAEHVIVLELEESPRSRRSSARRSLEPPNRVRSAALADDVQTPRDHDLFTALEVATGQIKASTWSAAARRASFRLHESCESRLSQLPDPCRLDETQDPQAQARSWLTGHKHVHILTSPRPNASRPQTRSRSGARILARSTLDGASSPRCDSCHAAIDAFNIHLQRHRDTLRMAQGQRPSRELQPQGSLIY